MLRTILSQMPINKLPEYTVWRPEQTAHSSIKLYVGLKAELHPRSMLPYFSNLSTDFYKKFSIIFPVLNIRSKIKQNQTVNIFKCPYIFHIKRRVPPNSHTLLLLSKKLFTVILLFSCQILLA